jgi:hypothetical protein
MTTTFIEKDALKSDTYDDAAQFTHVHAPLKSFIATPRTDTGLWDKLRSLWKSELKPGQYITKGADGLRYMMIITSNSYEDRDNETITSKALEAYEASCYPGEDLFHCDNPLLWWHDDDVPMGEIVAVNYSSPFLVEVAKELPSPTARVLWDYAEKNGDNAGASHRFGYRDEDRQPDGSYTHILKQETSYLPERLLAANVGTYAGVIDKMSTAQSDKRLNEIFNQATGGAIKDAASKIHAKTGELDKELAKLGITHKAKADGDVPEEVEEEVEGDKPVDEKADVTLPSDFMAKLQQLEAIYQMMMDMVSAQEVMTEDLGAAVDASTELAKAFNAMKTAQKAREDDLLKRVDILEKRLRLSQRRASQDVETDPDTVKASIDDAIKSAEDANLVESPLFGKLKPSPYATRNGK